MTNLITSTRDNTFLGMGIRQSTADLICWEYFLRTHDFNQIIELGTGNGGFSTWLLLQCVQRHRRFVTYDITTPKSFGRVARGAKLEKHCNALDLLLPSSPAKVFDSVARPVILYCDNGNKPVEVAMYSPYLVKGDYLVVHDWNVEIGKDNIPMQLIMNSEMDDMSNQYQSVTRFFTVV